MNAAIGTDYTASIAVLNAADFGVPQLRKRLFVIGSRDGSRCIWADSALLGDRGYDADWFREALQAKGIQPCIPGRR